jgi:hypothetical protein
MALTRDSIRRPVGNGDPKYVDRGIDGGSLIYEGALAVALSTGYAAPGGTAAADHTIGVASAQYDNVAGSDGDVSGRFMTGQFWFDNSSSTDEITVADIDKPCFVASDEAVAKTDGGGTRPMAGIVIDVDSDLGVKVLVGPSVSGGMTVQKRSVTVTHAELTAAATTETENIGAPLPANSRILAVSLRLGTVFSGITGPVTVDIGSSGDVDALIDGANLATAVDGEASTRPLGIAPNKLFAAATQLTATFLSASGNLVDCTAGSVIIDVLFVVLP